MRILNKKYIINSFIITLIVAMFVFVNSIHCDLYYAAQLLIAYDHPEAIDTVVQNEDGSVSFNYWENGYHYVCTYYSEGGEASCVVYDSSGNKIASGKEGDCRAQVEKNQSNGNNQSTSESSNKHSTSNDKISNSDSSPHNSSRTDSSKGENNKTTPSYSNEEIAAAWVETERVESTCVEAGHIDYSNSLTGETKTEELPLADHKYSETERKEATCTEVGAITYACEVCGDTYAEEIPALSHDYEWVTTKEATLFTQGEEQYVCKNCGDISETKEITSTSPVFVALLIAGVAVMIIGIGFFFIKMKND